MRAGRNSARRFFDERVFPKLLGECEMREAIMAFTDVEVTEAKDAINAGAQPEDLFRLGLIYSTDLEDKGPDFVEAHKWFNLAAMMGSMPAKAYREEIKAEMSHEDVTLAQRAARGWLAENRELLESAKQAA